MRIGYVYYNDNLCGTITQSDDNVFIFEYTEAWFEDEHTKSISITMPKTKKRYESNILFPFFDGLIPEGYLLEVALKKYNILSNDRMALLLKTCHNPIGIVSVREKMND